MAPVHLATRLADPSPAPPIAASPRVFGVSVSVPSWHSPTLGQKDWFWTDDSIDDVFRWLTPGDHIWTNNSTDQFWTRPTSVRNRFCEFFSGQNPGKARSMVWWQLAAVETPHDTGSKPGNHVVLTFYWTRHETSWNHMSMQNGPLLKWLPIFGFQWFSCGWG